MGHWGIKSYEIDEAADALDAAFEQVHGNVYIEMMEDDNPMTVEQIHQKLANPATLTAAIQALHDQTDRDATTWDEVERLGFVGIVVRHAENGIAIPPELRDLAIGWLENEEIEWEEATKRKLRREKEIALLTSK